MNRWKLCLFILANIIILLTFIVCVKNSPNEFEVDEDAHLFLADTVGTQPYILRADSNCYEMATAGDLVRLAKGYHELTLSPFAGGFNLEPRGIILKIRDQAFFLEPTDTVGLAVSVSDWCYLFCVDENRNDNAGLLLVTVDDDKVIEVSTFGDCFPLNEKAIRIPQQAGTHKISVTGQLNSGPMGVVVLFEETAYTVVSGYCREFVTETDEDIFVFFVDQYATDNDGFVTVHFK